MCQETAINCYGTKLCRNRKVYKRIARIFAICNSYGQQNYHSSSVANNFNFQLVANKIQNFLVFDDLENTKLASDFNH